jgi:hypothetical protein
MRFLAISMLFWPFFLKKLKIKKYGNYFYLLQPQKKGLNSYQELSFLCQSFLAMSLKSIREITLPLYFSSSTNPLKTKKFSLVMPMILFDLTWPTVSLDLHLRLLLILKIIIFLKKVFKILQKAVFLIMKMMNRIP